MQTLIRLALRCVLLTLPGLGPLLPCARAEVRLALLQVDPAPELGKLLALSEATLGQDPAFALLERGEIQRLLAEQGQQAMFDPRNGLRLGALLGVDCFALLEGHDPDKALADLVVFDARRGIRLWDGPIQTHPLPDGAEALAGALRASLAKSRNLQGNVNTFCLLSVRNVDLPAEEDSRCQSVGMLLERRLLRSENIVILERRRLDQVNQEAGLPGNTAAPELFPSLWTVDLELTGGLSTAKEWEARLVFRNGQGENVGEHRARAPRLEVMPLVEQLAVAVAEQLRMRPPDPWARPDREAERFVRESKFLQGHGDLSGSIRSAEAALALSPTNRVCQGQMILCLLEGARKMSERRNPAAENAGDAVLRALDLSTALLRAERKAMAADPQRRLREDAQVGAYDFLAFPGKYRPKPGHPLRPALRKWAREEWLDLVAANVRSDRDQLTYLHVLFTAQEQWSHIVPTPSEWQEDQLDLWRKHLDMIGRFPASWEWKMEFNRVLLNMVALSRRQAPAQRPAFQAFFEGMAEHSDPVARAYARIGRLALAGNEKDPQAFGEAVRYIRTLIADPGRAPLSVYRTLLYLAILDASHLFHPPAMRKELHQQNFEEMLRQGHLEWISIRMALVPAAEGQSPYDIFWTKPGNVRVSDDADFQRRLDNCERVLAAWKAGKLLDVSGTLFSWNKGSIDAMLAEQHLDLMRERPERFPPPAAPWEAAHSLFDARREGLASLGVSLRTEHALYFLGAEAAGTGLRLYEQPWDGTPARQLARLPGLREGNDLALDGDTIYVATPDQGVFAFSRLTGAPVSLGTNGVCLAGEPVDRIAALDGQLYVALRKQPLLLRHDPASGHTEQLVSGRRKEKTSALDDRPENYHFSYLRADPSRRRILFAPALKNEAAGLWEFRDGKIRHILPVPCSLSVFASDRPDRLLIYSWCWFSGLWSSMWCPYGVLDVDLATDSATMVASHDWRSGGESVESPLWQLHLLKDQGNPMFFHEEALWFRDSAGKIGILWPDRPLAEQHGLDGEAKGVRAMFLARDNTVFALHPEGIHALRLPESPTPTPAPPAPPTILTPTAFPFSLEIEAMRLTNARIVDAEGAGGGQAAILDPKHGRAVCRLNLPPGDYAFDVFARFKRDPNDHVRIHFDHGHIIKLAIPEENAWGICQHFYKHDRIVRNVSTNSPLHVMIGSSAPGVELDRLIISPIPPPAP